VGALFGGGLGPVQRNQGCGSGIRDGQKRTHTPTYNQESIQDKLFTVITSKVITMMKSKGVRALDELAGPNRGKIRLLSRADEKRYNKGKRNGSRHRAEGVIIIHEMTIEEARNTEVSIITRTERGRYGNAHKI
jgi:hypothetical protein